MPRLTSISQELNSHLKNAFTVRLIVMHSSPADLRVFAAGGVLAGCVQGLAGVLLGAVAVATTALGALINAGRWVVQIVLLGLLFTLLFEYYPQFVEDAIRYYNDGFGSGLRNTSAMMPAPARSLGPPVKRTPRSAASCCASRVLKKSGCRSCATAEGDGSRRRRGAAGGATDAQRRPAPADLLRSGQQRRRRP